MMETNMSTEQSDVLMKPGEDGEILEDGEIEDDANESIKDAGTVAEYSVFKNGDSPVVQTSQNDDEEVQEDSSSNDESKRRKKSHKRRRHDDKRSKHKKRKVG